MNADLETVLLTLWEAGVEVDASTRLTSTRLIEAKAILAPVFCRRPEKTITAEEVARAPELPSDLDPERTTYVTADEVIEVHEALVQEFAGSDDAVDPPGLRDPAFLEAALLRPTTSLSGVRKYGTVALSAAALLHSLVHNHPFHNGNKRTALLVYCLFLERNSYLLQFTEEELYDLVVAVAAHDLPDVPVREGRPVADSEVAAIWVWTCDHTRAAESGERKLPYLRLERILRSYGCTVGTPHDGRLDIFRHDRRTQIKLRNRGAEIRPDTVRKIRRELELDDSHGVDSRIFYDAGSPNPDVHEIMRRYRGVLRRLAVFDRS